jgi:hypothetical protein
MCKVLIAVLAAVELLLHGTAALSQAFDEKVRKSLVYMEVSGPNNADILQQNGGTGFFLTEDGYILTSATVFERVSDIRKDKRQIKVFVYEKSSETDFRTAKFIAEGNDLVLLKIAPRQQPYDVATLGSARKAEIGTKVNRSGFASTPTAVQHQRWTDEITGQDVDGNLTLKAGFVNEHSGSPVYDEDGSIVAVLKGKSVSGDTIAIPLQKATTMFLDIGLDVRMPFGHWLQSESGRKALSTWFADFMKSGGMDILQHEMEVYFKAQPEKIISRLDTYMKGVVAYSYSSVFDLSSQNPSYSMPFFKTDDDRGTISCTASGNTLIKNKVYAIFNDKPDLPGAREYFKADRSWKRELLPLQNKALYDPDPPGGRTSVNPDMRIRFQIEDVPNFKGGLRLECTIQIIGPAHIATSSQ